MIYTERKTVKGKKLITVVRQRGILEEEILFGFHCVEGRIVVENNQMNIGAWPG